MDPILSDADDCRDLLKQHDIRRYFAIDASLRSPLLWAVAFPAGFNAGADVSNAMSDLVLEWQS